MYVDSKFINQRDLGHENDVLRDALEKLCIEYSDYRMECEEICKEYEETIQLLTTSVENFRTEISKLTVEKNNYLNENSHFKIEIEKLREKNKDKIKDIEILNNKLSDLEFKFQSNNKKQSSLKSKVVILETDNDHYLNKIHQYEEEVIDLKYSLENTIENLITTQNEFEEYKNKNEEYIQRLKQEFQEEKNNFLVKRKRSKLEDNKENEKNNKTKLKNNSVNHENGITLNNFSENDDDDFITEKNKSYTISEGMMDYEEDDINKLRKRKDKLMKFHNKIKNSVATNELLNLNNTKTLLYE